MDNTSEGQQPVVKQAWEAPQLTTLGAEQAEGKNTDSYFEASLPGSSYGPS